MQEGQAAKRRHLKRNGVTVVRPAACRVGNPIGAAGLMKVAELFWQLRHEAGARQVPGNPKRGLAQAWGDLMQVGTVIVLGVDK